MKQPVLKPVPDMDLYLLVKDYKLKCGRYEFVIPKGFAFDGASIPSIAWHGIGTPFEPQFMLPSMVHDWIYIVHTYSREEADDLFYELLKENGVKEAKAFVMWMAVRAGGWYGWVHNEDKLKELEELHNKTKKRWIFKLWLQKYMYQFGFYNKAVLLEDIESIKYF